MVSNAAESSIAETPRMTGVPSQIARHESAAEFRNHQGSGVSRPNPISKDNNASTKQFVATAALSSGRMSARTLLVRGPVLSRRWYKTDLFSQSVRAIDR